MPDHRPEAKHTMNVSHVKTAWWGNLQTEVFPVRIHINLSIMVQSGYPVFDRAYCTCAIEPGISIFHPSDFRHFLYFFVCKNVGLIMKYYIFVNRLFLL